MKLSFRIHFHTLWGQSLYVVGSIPQLGNGEPSKAALMNYLDEGIWRLDIEVPDNTKSFEYTYFLKHNEEIIFEEWKKIHHTFEAKKGFASYLIQDYWQDQPRDSVFYSSAFTKSLFAHSADSKKSSDKDTLIKVWIPTLRKEQRPAVFGNCWDNWKQPQWLVPAGDSEWEFSFDRKGLLSPLEYKFCVLEGNDRIWEEGDNRYLELSLPDEDTCLIVSGLRFRGNTSPDWKCPGVSIPVFSLRSEKSFGIGDFADLRLMVDWAELTGQKIIQILPINDTTMKHTWEDSYPYNAISIYALHPLYLRLDRMGLLRDKKRLAYYQSKQEELNALPALDYDRVGAYKWEYFREIYKQDGGETLNSKPFRRFFKEHKEWLVSYAAYSFLRDKYQTPDFSHWGEYTLYNKSLIDTLAIKESEAFGLYYFLQYHLDAQLTEACDYAHRKGVVLKGDIPIGVSRISVDAWVEPDYFNRNFQAGAPPDDFSIDGQNWGFPTYNWEAMEADGYRWWKNRFAHISRYFDAYRIDHILGFFRIWEIPRESIDGLLGYFYPSLPFSVKEMEAAGMRFSKEYYTIPRIKNNHLDDIFGEYTAEVKQVYLDRVDASFFVLKHKFDTQRKIEEHFEGKDDDKSLLLKAGLRLICREVLFIEDKERTGYFHPRISAGHSYIYKDMPEQDRNAFDFLYWDYYYNRQNEFWKRQALKKLQPLINSTSMLACGEDLGMIPASVPEVMEQLQILSLEIERMPKSPNVEFTCLSRLPYLSVCTTSTHDMSTLRGWWKEDKEKIQRYYNQVLRHEGTAPLDCPPEICRQIIADHLQSAAIFCVIPWQDWLSIDGQLRNPDIDAERINIPADPCHYWQYRMHITIERLLAESSFNQEVRQLAGRI